MLSRDNFILFFLFLILIFFGAWQLPKSPATWFDEGINLGIAKSLIQDGVYSLKIGPDEFVESRQFLITSNYPVLLPVALSIKLFGFNLAAARAPMVLFLFLFALAAYFLVKKLYGKTAALMSVALIVSFTPFYGNGKAVLGEIPGLFYFLCALILLILPGKKPSREYFCGFGSEQAWFFRRAKNCEAFTPSSGAGRNEESKNTARLVFNLRLLFAGFFAGLSAATKPFFLIVPIAVLPMAIWLYTILPSFSFGGFLSAITYYSNSYASTNFGNLIWANFLRFFTESTPIHFAVLFLVSAAFLVWKRKSKPRSSTLGVESPKTPSVFPRGFDFIENTLAIFVLLTMAFYLKTPGWYRYFFPAHMILFLIFPAALIYLLNKKIAISVVVLLFLFQLGYTINQRNTSIYYSDEAEMFSKYVMETTAPQDKNLIINGPSAAFLIENRQVYQYLQINPVLSFGRGDAAGYSYISVQGALAESLDQNLKSDYTVHKQVGHYALYRKINF